MEIMNNQVTISGEVVDQFVYSHNVFGERFFMTKIRIERLSEEEDYLPLMISDRLVDVNQSFSGNHITVKGQFRSYNDWQDGRSRLKLYIFAREISFDEYPIHINSIILDGFICKETIYRQTPKGRQIADLMVAVNRPYGKSDYIPCICWGRNAKFASGFYPGLHVQLVGRIQSREYAKRWPSGEQDICTAYEVSVSKIEVACDE